MKKSILFSTKRIAIIKSSSLRKVFSLALAGFLSSAMSYGQMAGGTYTINSGNPTSGSNFNSFNDFITALSNAGNSIAGAVTVKVLESDAVMTF